MMNFYFKGFNVSSKRKERKKENRRILKKISLHLDELVSFVGNGKKHLNSITNE